jgi:hypothetical protein
VVDTYLFADSPHRGPVRTTLRRERKKRVKGLFLELRLVIYRVGLSHTEPLVIPNP